MPLHLRHGHAESSEVTFTGSSHSPTNLSHESASTMTENQQTRHWRRRKQRLLTHTISSTACYAWSLRVVCLLALVVYGHWSLSFLRTVTSEEYVSRKILSENHYKHNSVTTASSNATTNHQSPHVVTPLNDKDTAQYTVRINTWQRPEQLRVAIVHYLHCERVALVQVVWCTAQGPPPEWLVTMDQRVVVEEHTQNSLNARFDVLSEPPTRGILSVDDDVLRPCLAMDVAFCKWTSYPDRLVGFDARTHVVINDDNETRWKYGYLSETTRTNRYSITLSRFAFVHVDHLHSYTHDPMLAPYRAMVTEHRNCEDILLSFWVSHQTACQPPLLADYWASKSMIKLWTAQAISGTQSHKQFRDECVDTFRRGLALDCLERGQWIHRDAGTGRPSYWHAGAPADTIFLPNQASIEALVTRWKESVDDRLMGEELMEMVKQAAILPYEHGLIEGSPTWKKKYGQNSS